MHRDQARLKDARIVRGIVGAAYSGDCRHAESRTQPEGARAAQSRFLCAASRTARLCCMCGRRRRQRGLSAACSSRGAAPPRGSHSLPTTPSSPSPPPLQHRSRRPPRLLVHSLSPAMTAPHSCDCNDAKDSHRPPPHRPHRQPPRHPPVRHRQVRRQPVPPPTPRSASSKTSDRPPTGPVFPAKASRSLLPSTTSSPPPPSPASSASRPPSNSPTFEVVSARTDSDYGLDVEPPRS